MCTNVFHQAAMTAIAVQLNPDEIGNLKKIFIALDKNGKGTLCMEEIENGLKELKIKNVAKMLKNIIAGDIEGKGEINYT